MNRRAFLLFSAAATAPLLAAAHTGEASREKMLPCDGSERDIAEYPELFLALGGAACAGGLTFRLPDLDDEVRYEEFKGGMALKWEPYIVAAANRAGGRVGNRTKYATAVLYPMDGRALSIANDAKVYGVIGKDYGYDADAQTFNLPDTRHVPGHHTHIEVEDIQRDGIITTRVMCMKPWAHQWVPYTSKGKTEDESR